MKQRSFTDFEYSMRKRVSKKEVFLKSMNNFIPWNEWVALIEPHYPKGKTGRPPMGIEKMLKMYLLQCWYNLSDEGTEDAIYDSYAMRNFVDINFIDEQVPDATTLLKFRHLLEKHGIAKQFFESFKSALTINGYMMQGGTIVDATLIAAPSSTKNRKKERDPEMHQTKKGNQYYFGMKSHIGVDAGSGYIHSIETTAANEHDITVTSKLIRSEDDVVYGDSGYIGIEKREEIKNDSHLASIDYRINRRPSSVQKTPEGMINYEKQIERQKSSIRSKVEHSFLIIKRTFGFVKTVYRGIKKNSHRLHILYTSANVLMLIRSGRRLKSA